MMDSKFSLQQICHIQNDSKGFVGIRSENGRMAVYFPMGYDLSVDNDSELRKDILGLLKVLCFFNRNERQGDKSNIAPTGEEKFPFFSYQYIISDFLSHGYFSEDEKQFSRNAKGKIIWKKTIRECRPVFDNDNLVYLEFVTQKNTLKEDTNIRAIHQYCVYMSFLKLGWLYTDYLPPEPNCVFSLSQMTTILRNKLKNTFDDRKKMLIQSMLNILSNKDNETLSRGPSHYGTFLFESVWEKLIDYIFGVEGAEKEKFFPFTTWTLFHKDGCGYVSPVMNSNLYPDTIMLTQDSDTVYILDAKYYSFSTIQGNTAEYIPRGLPESSSIQKQITYGKYLKTDSAIKKIGRESHFKKIYNAFLLPCNRKKLNSDAIFFPFGIANAEWEKRDVEYKNILGVMVDTKSLIRNFSRLHQRHAEELSSIIECSIEKYIKDSKK